MLCNVERCRLELLPEGDGDGAIAAAVIAATARLSKTFRQNVNRPVAIELDWSYFTNSISVAVRLRQVADTGTQIFADQFINLKP